MKKQSYKEVMARLIYAWIVLFILILSLFIYLGTISNYLKQYRAMATEQLKLVEFIYKTELVSNNLSMNVRYFSLGFDPAALSAYWQELQKIRRSDDYLMYLKNLHLDQSVLQQFVKAKKMGDTIRENELRSIKLIVTANGVNSSVLPEEIQNFSLTEAEMNLSRDEKLKLAHQLVQTDDYLSQKSQIIQIIQHARLQVQQQSAASLHKIEEKIDYGMLYLKIMAFFALCMVIIIIWIRALSIRKLLH